MDIVLSNLSPLLDRLRITLSIAVLSFLGAMVIGTLVAVMRISPIAPLRAVGLVYVEFFRNIPLLCLLFLVVFGLPDIGVLFSLYNSAVIAMAMFSGAFVCESIRTGINTVAGRAGRGGPVDRPDLRASRCASSSSRRRCGRWSSRWSTSGSAR